MSPNAANAATSTTRDDASAPADETNTTPADATKRADIPSHAQVMMVHSVVLPLLHKLNIPTTIETSPAGTITLTLSIEEPHTVDVAANAAPSEAPVGTLSSEQAEALWRLRERIEEQRRAVEAAQAV